jgi:hypothetical protein
MFGRNSELFTRFGLPSDAGDVRHMIVLHPTMAHQIANAGFTKESFIRYLYEQNVIDYDRMTPEQREDLIKRLTEEESKGIAVMHPLRPEDVRPGLLREPFSSKDQVLIMVAGSGAGNVVVFSDYLWFDRKKR